MYTVSEILYIGDYELILADIKYEPAVDDSEPVTWSCEEVFDSCD